MTPLDNSFHSLYSRMGIRRRLEIDIIQFRDVYISFGPERVLDGISFSVKRGEFLCLLGASGCGKSTTLRVIGDLLPSYRGQVVVDDRPPKESWSKIAYVFQSPRLVPWRNALENVLLGMELRHERGKGNEMHKTALKYLEMVGLASDIHKYPLVLSGGE